MSLFHMFCIINNQNICSTYMSTDISRFLWMTLYQLAFNTNRAGHQSSLVPRPRVSSCHQLELTMWCPDVSGCVLRIYYGFVITLIAGHKILWQSWISRKVQSRMWYIRVGVPYMGLPVVEINSEIDKTCTHLTTWAFPVKLTRISLWSRYISTVHLYDITMGTSAI